MLGGVLYVGGRYGLNSRCERAKVEVGGAVRIQGIDVDRPPVDVGHDGSCTIAFIGVRKGGGRSAAGCRGVVVCWGALGEVATRAPCRGVQSSTFLSWRAGGAKGGGASGGTANCCTNKGRIQARQNDPVSVFRRPGIYRCCGGDQRWRHRYDGNDSGAVDETVTVRGEHDETAYNEYVVHCY